MPWSSSKVERFNKTLKQAIAKELKGESNDWDKILPKVTFYYNCTIQMTTGMTPFELATGRLPVMPADVVMGEKPDKLSHNEYANETIDKLTKLSRSVFETTRQQQQFQQREYNKRIHGEPLEVGDLVRVRYNGPAPPGITTKLLPRWRGPFPIVEKLGDRSYVVNMPHRGRMVPRVQNIRHLWRVGELKENSEDMDDEEEKDLALDNLWTEEDTDADAISEGIHDHSPDAIRLGERDHGYDVQRDVVTRYGRRIIKPARFQ